jgi:hypothetical protein
MFNFVVSSLRCSVMATTSDTISILCSLTLNVSPECAATSSEIAEIVDILSTISLFAPASSLT